MGQKTMEFSKNMQKAMERAVRLAQKGQHNYFMPEHMIYGLACDEVFSQEYELLGGDVEELKSQILKYLEEQAEKSGNEGNLRLTNDAEKVLCMAESQARTSGRKTVDTFHVI